MLHKYAYIIRELDGDGNEHECSGYVESDSVQGAVADALRDSFRQLTGGDTEYGKPRTKSCRGPYTVLDVMLSLLPLRR